MHVENVEAALLGGDVPGLEDAFRALVADEDEVDAVDSADDSVDLLMRVCDALAADQRIMPGWVADLIQEETGGVLADLAYAGGAAAVKANIEVWRAICARRIGA